MSARLFGCVMPLNDISDDELRRIVSLFEMTHRASQEEADETIRNEAANAFAALLRLLAKYGLSVADIPAIQQRHQEIEAVKAANKAANATATSNQTEPNAFDLVHYMLQNYVDMKSHEYVAVTLWILHTHVYEQFMITPRLALLSPVRGCGKSMVLTLALRLAANAEKHDHITAAALFRAIERSRPSTQLLDEGDNLGLKLDRVIRAVLNSGYLQDGHITRTIRNEPQAFATFAAVAIAAIGTLTLPLLHRSIAVQMQRTLRTDLKAFEDLKTPEETARLDVVYRKIVAWKQNAQFRKDLQLPKKLHGRLGNNWRVLLAIADTFGAPWSNMAREAATLFAADSSDEDACVSLLYDTRTIFRAENIDRIKSAVLVEKLLEMDDGVGIWDAYRGEADDQSPHRITQGEVATLFRRFDRGLRPKPLFERGSRETRGKAGRGYYREQLEPWWKIYCREDGPADDPSKTPQRLRSE
jgi:hypothetical protein